MSAPFRFGSVCSGIEAASVAWRPLGWRASFFSEIEAFPRAVLAHRWPGIPLHGDFTTIEDGQYEPIDLLVGGTPCQSFSIAGLRGGLADDRGNLALEYLRLADRLRPRWLVWENVPGVLSSGGGRDFGTVLGGVAELGYGFAYRVLDAQYFGVPQRRRRVFVVGHLGDWRRAAAVLFERHSLQGHPPPRREAGARTSSRPAFGISSDCFDRSGEGAGGSPGERSGLGISEELSPTIRAKRPNAVAVGVDGGSEISHALTACRTATGRLDPSMQTFVAAEVTGTMRSNGDAHSGFQLGDGLIAHALRAEGFDASEDGTGRGTPLVPVAFPILEIGKRAGPSADAPRAGMGIGDAEAPMFTLQAGAQHGIGCSAGVRRLTPRECERLQGFPDDYTLVPYRGKPAADGPRYKALGNSMAVPVMAWIGQRIQMVEALA